MILVRDVFQAKYGKTDELVKLLKEAAKSFPEAGYGSRVLTDASGTFFCVINETEVESLGAWEHRLAEIFSNPDFGAWFTRMESLVEGGRREFYNLIP